MVHNGMALYRNQLFATLTSSWSKENGIYYQQFLVFIPILGISAESKHIESLEVISSLRFPVF